MREGLLAGGRVEEGALLRLPLCLLRMTAHVGKRMGWWRSSVGKMTSETYTSNPVERDSVLKKKKQKTSTFLKSQLGTEAELMSQSQHTNEP